MKDKMYVLIFSQLVSKTFLIPRIIQKDIVINIHMSSCKVSVILAIF
jgi:hypothetical protein